LGAFFTEMPVNSGLLNSDQNDLDVISFELTLCTTS